MRIMVAGLARCGSSLMMQILDAGGYPCFGDFPDFEREYMPPGKKCIAFKVLQPMLQPNRYDPSWVIWLDREVEDQAQSMVKYMVDQRAKHKRSPYSRVERRGALQIAKSNLRKQYKSADWWLNSLRVPHDRINFSDLVRDPKSVVGHLNGTIGLGLTDQATSPVIDRPDRCLPFMLEHRLLRLRGRR